MKLALASLGASALMACGGEPDVDAILYIDPPKGGGNCVGVAGFEVLVSPAGRAAQTDKLVGSEPILDANVCALPRPLTIRDLDIDAPITVTVRGYDGSGVSSRVSASKTITSLRDGPIRLELQAASSPFPLLVFYRNALLQSTPVSAVTSMVISTQRQMEPLLTVSRHTAGPFFDAEPGAYGIPIGLLAGGGDNMLDLNVQFTTTGSTQPRGKITALWNASRGYYEAR